jgi:EAL domain-containing protein (putative c-di-GMP-specific phosphodiesterase class I)
MYRAKAAGKHRFVFYEPEMNRRAEERARLGRELRHAYDRDQFQLCFQPQYDLGDGHLTAVEALMRWRDDAGQLVEPTRVVPLDEDSRLGQSLAHWLLEEGCRQARQWLDQGLDFGRLAVNIAGPQFQGARLPETVLRVLDATGLPGDRLALEISEAWLMEGPYRAAEQMREVNGFGVDFVVDGFGVANVSLSYLKRFPVSRLKIDRSFVRGLPAAADDAAIVSAIIAMGHSLALRVVAEGVEDARQSIFLRSTGCDEALGAFYGAPMAADEMNVQLLYSPLLSRG